MPRLFARTISPTPRPKRPPTGPLSSPPASPRTGIRMNGSPAASTTPPPLDAPSLERLQQSLQGSRPVRAALDAGSPVDRQFAQMAAAFKASGGLARGDELARLLDDQGRGNARSLVELIAQREVFCFEWGGAHWLPMFQFSPQNLSVRIGPQRVYRELGTVFDGWALAAWYTQANHWLRGERPVDRLTADLDEVLEAARADRYIAAG